jgi:hypothetical protein
LSWSISEDRRWLNSYSINECYGLVLTRYFKDFLSVLLLFIDSETGNCPSADKYANIHNKILHGTRRCPITVMASLRDLSVLLKTEEQQEPFVPSRFLTTTQDFAMLKISYIVYKIIMLLILVRNE